MREKEVEHGIAGAAGIMQFRRLVSIPAMKFLTQGLASYVPWVILELLSVFVWPTR